MKNNFSILFVDDEEMTRKYFTMGLKNTFNILTAGSVDEAKAIIAKQHETIAIVITDQKMPGGNGVILLKFLRENYPDIVRMLTTAYSDLQDAIDGVNNGEIFRYIQKPWADKFDLLKTEFMQAMELFDLKKERSKLLHEKLSIRKKMIKLERVRFLLSLAETLDIKGCGVHCFIRQIASIDTDHTQEYDLSILETLDLGSEDISEASFHISLVKKIKDKMSEFSSINFDEITNEKIAAFFNLNKTITTIQSGSNKDIVNVSFQKLLLENSNIFTMNPKKIGSGFYINLLVFFMILYSKDIVINSAFNDETLTLSIQKSPAKTSESIENVILSVILE
jgi:CheY-like chemotaxis protein